MLLPYAALEQYVQRVAFASPLSAHAGHVSIRGPGGADFSLRRDPGHPRHAMITKSTTEPRRLPTAMVVRTLPSGAVLKQSIGFLSVAGLPAPPPVVRAETALVPYRDLVIQGATSS